MRQVLITGASSDIGVATCKKYLAEGFKVIGHYNKGQTSFFDLIDDSENMVVQNSNNADKHHLKLQNQIFGSNSSK